MAAETFRLLATPTPEGTTKIEVHFKVVENEERKPVANFWLFAIMTFLERLVHTACRCTPRAAYTSATIQQGEVVHQRFPAMRLEDGQGYKIELDLPTGQAARPQSLLLSNCN